MPRGYSFRPRPWAVALAAACFVAFASLGTWQAGRAEQKRVAVATVERIELSGTLLSRYTVLLDNKLHRGRPGYHVVQPLLVRNASGESVYVLVNRGWIDGGPRRDVLPEVRTPTGDVVVEGVKLARFPRVYDARNPGQGIVWQNASVEAFAAWSGLKLADYVVEQHSAANDGLVREWTRAGARVETHQSYALQWYSLAALSVALLVVLGWRRDVAAAG